MRRYEADIKAKALARAREAGVKKAGEELGISIQTLYKWRNESKSAQALLKERPGTARKNSELAALIKNDRTLEKKVKQLEAENAELRMTITTLRKALLAVVE